MLTTTVGGESLHCGKMCAAIAALNVRDAILSRDLHRPHHLATCVKKCTDTVTAPTAWFDSAMFSACTGLNQARPVSQSHRAGLDPGTPRFKVRSSTVFAIAAPIYTYLPWNEQSFSEYPVWQVHEKRVHPPSLHSRFCVVPFRQG